MLNLRNMAGFASINLKLEMVNLDLDMLNLVSIIEIIYAFDISCMFAIE